MIRGTLNDGEPTVGAWIEGCSTKRTVETGCGSTETGRGSISDRTVCGVTGTGGGSIGETDDAGSNDFV